MDRAYQWLRKCGRVIANRGEAIRWTSPVGMIVKRMPERRKRVKTSGFCLNVIDRTDKAPIDKRKQVDGIAPNFVHSLDAAHMMRTAIACGRAQIAFAAVHDCFWTHAADMDKLSVILRDEFITIHERPALEVLHEELQHNYPAVSLPPPPRLGSLDLDAVRQSPYFFA
jgi:DNA-directed RNA polymerase